VRWLANEDWQFDGSLFYADADNGYDEWSMDNTRFDTYADKLGRDEQETIGGAIRANWTSLSDVDVTTVTSATHTDSLNSYDSDWTNNDDEPGNYAGFMAVDRTRDVFSQELRLDSAQKQDALGWIDRWTLGAYVSLLKEDSDVDYSDAFSAPTQPLAPVFSDSKYSSHNYALFTQIAHDFSERTRLIIGLRAEYYDIEVESSGVYYGSPLPNDTEGENGVLWGGKITLEHDLNEQHTGFASVTRGYKAGGANTAAFLDTIAGNPTTYDDETLYNFELGIHSKWFDDQVISQITAFYLYRDEPQLRASSGNGGFFNYFTSNGDRAQHFGIEAEATWFISQEWTARAGIGMLQAEDGDHEELASVPAYTFNAQLNYQAASGFFAELNAQGSDEYYESNNPQRRSQRVRNAFVTVNASLGYRYENWTFTLWGRNLFDEEYEKRVFFFDNGQGDQRYENPANPRTFGVTANYSW